MHVNRAVYNTIKRQNSSYSEPHSSKKTPFSLIRSSKSRIWFRNPTLSSRISPVDTEVNSHIMYKRLESGAQKKTIPIFMVLISNLSVH